MFNSRHTYQVVVAGARFKCPIPWCDKGTYVVFNEQILVSNGINLSDCSLSRCYAAFEHIMMCHLERLCVK